MKRNVLLSLICSLLVIAFTFAVFPMSVLAADEQVVTTRNVNFRDMPGTKGTSVIMTIPRGTELKRTGVEQRYAKVEYNGQWGYVYNSYVKLSTAGAEATGDAQAAAISGASTGQMFTTRRCNVRAGSDKGTKLLGTLALGTTVDIYEKSGKYTKINYNGLAGYVFTAYLSQTKVEQPTVNTVTGKPAFVNYDHQYYIYVEKGSYTVTIYNRTAANTYEVYAKYRTAHGGNKTPAGVYTLGSRERWHKFSGSYAQYATSYNGRLLIHSPLYKKQDPNTIMPKYYNGAKGIGKSSSGGCLRMVTKACKFIYNNCEAGTVVHIVNGKPLGTRSSGIPDLGGCNYDPTDDSAVK